MIGTRIISGTVLVGAVVAFGYWLPSIGVWAVLVLVGAGTVLEFFAMMDAAGVPSFRYLGVISAAALITATFFSLARTGSGAVSPSEAESLVVAAVVLAVLLRQFPQKHNNLPLPTMACTMFGILYVPFLFDFFTRLLFAWEPVSLWDPVGNTGRILVFYLIIVVKAVDTGAFAAGSLLGRHKLLPRISAGKTWEGVIGGVLTGFLATAAFFVMYRTPSGAAAFGALTVHPHDAVALGFALSVVGIVGDLAESLIKRACGVKDSGRAVPGMGGALDLLDSLLFTAPILYFYARFFLR